jgi:diguanylate cyclase (GGDEF)-like protein/PAS domain S-box-containing protein
LASPAYYAKATRSRAESGSASVSLRLYGYSAQEAIGRPIAFLCPLDREDEIPEVLGRVGRGERVEHLESVRRRRDGSDVQVSLTISPIADASGAVVGASTIARDISERKRAERAREQLVAVVERSSDGVLVVDGFGVVVFANPAAGALMGRGRADVVGREVGFPVSAGEVSEIELISPARTVAYAEMRVVETEWDGRPCLLALLRDVTDRHRVEAEMARRSTHDHLTGLPNRFLLEDRLERVLAGLGRRQDSLAVFVVDLDDFKEVNDRFGHLAGDAVLVEVAARIKRALRDVDTAARLGGDEFVLVCEAMTPGACSLLVARLQRAFGEPIAIPGSTVTLSASIGFALTNDSACAPAQIITAADKAMYSRKRRAQADHAAMAW